jgi:hypothetical protein
MNEILNKRHNAKIFWWAVIPTVFLLIALRYYIIPTYYETDVNAVNFFESVLDNIIAGIITTIAIGAFLFHIRPKPEMDAKFISSKKFNTYFSSLLDAEPDEWYFRGGFGRYLRSEVLPRLNQIASGGTTVKVYAQLLNPSNDKLCELHKDLRNTTSQTKIKERWTVNMVKANLYATIVVASIYESKNTLLDITVHLIDFFSSDRIDISSKSGIITKDDRKMPGLTFQKESPHYDAYKTDLTITERQAVDKVKALKNGQDYEPGHLTKDHVKEILTELNFSEGDFRKEDYNLIAKLSNEFNNPY